LEDEFVSSAKGQADKSDDQRRVRACRWVARIRALIEKLHKQEREFGKGLVERLYEGAEDPQQIICLCEEFERCAAPRLRNLSPIRTSSPLASWRREVTGAHASVTADLLPGQLELFECEDG
jgi:hypothetical protein